ncbi:TPA: hypothetical protein ACH3X1_007925 [Trebouxia sp. C0004]
MTALAYCTTTSLCCSCLTLTWRAGWQVPNFRHDPDAAVVVTEVWQLFVSAGGAVDTAFVALLTAFGAVDTAFGAWHGGHSLWISAVEQRTQPCGASRKWTSPLGSGPGNLPLKTRVPSNRRTLPRLK